jgi:hypothetical protein
MPLDCQVLSRIVTRGCAIALGEWWCGAAKDARHIVALAAADSVHSGLVVNGVPFEGARGLAGAAAWLALNPVEREDYRRLGSLQAEIGAAGIVRRLVWRIKSGDPSRVLDMAGGDITAIQLHPDLRCGAGRRRRFHLGRSRYGALCGNGGRGISSPSRIQTSWYSVDSWQMLRINYCSRHRRKRFGGCRSTWAESLRVCTAALGDDGAPIGAARAAMIAQ